MLAAQGGHTEMVKALIEAGANVNLISRVSFGIYAVLIVVLLWFPIPVWKDSPNAGYSRWVYWNY